MPKLLPLKDFRARRRILTKEDFALPGNDVSPRDPIDRDTWEKLTTLPTDVATQTSDHNGTRLKNLYVLWSAWIEAIAIPIEGEPYPPDMMCAPMLAAGEEFDAALFTLLHGFYRPSIGCARNALELVAIACACESLKLHEQFEAWQDGTKEFGFGEACNQLSGAQSLQKLRNRLANKWNDSLFDQKKGKTPGGWLRRLYAGLSNYSHSRPRIYQR